MKTPSHFREEILAFGTNLLGGRAWRYLFFPLVYPEITDFDLLKVLNYGTIPSHYRSEDPKKSLKSYVQDYLTEEIKQESVVRNLPAFSRFLESVGYSNGQMLEHYILTEIMAL